jgi:hypothetical protein
MGLTHLPVKPSGGDTGYGNHKQEKDNFYYPNNAKSGGPKCFEGVNSENRQ